MIRKLICIPLALVGFVHADSSNDSDNDKVIPEGQIIDYPSIYHDVTPSAGPRVVDGVGMFLTGDYIYWTARQDAMQYATTGYGADSSTNVSRGSAAILKYKFQTGFKAGLGFSFGHDYWDMAFNYTWYQSNNNKGSVHATQGGGLTPTFTPVLNMTTGDYFTGANAVWRLHFNTLDWELGRNFYISKYLSLRPFVGLKGSWQNQHYNTTYSGYVDSESFQYLRKLTSSFMGLGIRTGWNMGWHLAGTWSLYTDVALSALWGQFKTSRDDTIDFETMDTHPVSASFQNHTASPVLELAVGLRKDQWFCNNRFHVGVQAGWEEQIWWDQNQFPHDRGISQPGTLVLQGLSVRIRFDF